MKDIITEERNIIERYAPHIKRSHNLPPIAARILVALMIHGSKGLSFEQLVELIQASKSTISNNINTLINMERVTYYTKSGDRKRYFKLDVNIFKKHIDKVIKNNEVEIEMIDFMSAFKLEANKHIDNPEDQYSSVGRQLKVKHFIVELTEIMKEFRQEIDNNNSQK